MVARRIFSDEEIKTLKSRLHDHMLYEDGDLVWKVPVSRRCKTGDLVGYENSDGYICVYFYGAIYKLHHLIWLLHKGEWPTEDIDHKDRDRSNNSIENLRTTTSWMHRHNRDWNKELPKGVCYCPKSKNKYRVLIKYKHEIIHHGYYETEQEACDVAEQIYLHLERLDSYDQIKG